MAERWTRSELLIVGAGAGVAATGRIAARLGLDERVLAPTEAAVAVLEHGGAPACIVLEAGAFEEPLLARALAAAARLAGEPGRGVAVAFAPPQIDRIAAALLPTDAVLLCAPDDAERIAGVALAAARARIVPVLGERQADRLGTLAEEVARIARLLADLSAEGEPGPAPARPDGGGAAIDAAFVRRLIRLRRLRERHFDAAMFADPAWDMLLDLAAARAEGAEVAVSSLCIAAAVPPTTALRWIGTMERAGLIVRRADPVDGRRAFLALGEDAAGAMAMWLRDATEVLGAA